MCVLFEDLRIEIGGLAERSLPALDILDPESDNWLEPRQTGKYRKFYFIRRSLATLREFAESLRLIIEDMNEDPDLCLTFRGPRYAEAKPAWDAAVEFFKTNEKLVNEIRGDIGGHFGHKAALNALSMLSPDACGSIALVDGHQKLRLHFAAQIAGTALLKHLPNGVIMEFEALLRDCLLPGYRHAINCVSILVRAYLWERFGS